MYSKKISFRKQIIKHLYFNHSMSCTGLSHEIGKSIPYTSKLLDDLLDQRYVVETGFAESTGGRRPLMYTLREDMIFVAMVVIDHYVTRIAVMDMRNRYVGNVEKLELNVSATETCFAIIAERLEAVIKKSGIEKKKFAGIGIGLPDMPISSGGKINAFLDPQSKENFATYISQAFGLPVSVRNNATLIGLAEFRFGAAYKRKNAIIVNIGWSLGLSLVLNGELFRGAQDNVPEFSHLPLFLNDISCSCGKTGCLDTEASLVMIMEKTMRKLKAGETSSVLNYATLQKEHPLQRYGEMISAVHNGDAFAIEQFTEAGHAMGRALSILINLLNPELIVLSGTGSLAGKVWKDTVQSSLREHCAAKLISNVELKRSSLGHEPELLGAATLVMENFEKERKDLLNRKKQIVHY